ILFYFSICLCPPISTLFPYTTLFRSVLPCDDCFAFELFLQVCGVNHGGVGVDGVRDVVRLFDEDELRTSETDGAVECAAAADHEIGRASGREREEMTVAVGVGEEKKR